MSLTMEASRPVRLPLLALLAANTVSEIGSTFTLVALPWFVLQSTGSAARTGLTGFAVAIPGFLIGIFGGTVIDRLGYRRSSVIADLVSGVGLGLVPTLYFTVGLPFVLLMVLVFIGSMLAIPGITARRAMLPELGNMADVRLERVNAAFESIQQIALLLGPPVAGLLIAWQSATTVLWIDGATFLFSAVAISLFVPTFNHLAQAEVRTRYREQLIAGLKFLAKDSLLRDMAITLAVFNGLNEPFFAVAMPVFARQAFGNATVLGLMASGYALGALSGVAAYGAVGYRLSRKRIWFVSYLLSPGFYWSLAVHPNLPLLLLILAFMGFITGPISPLMVTIRHERIPPAMRGRVFATYSAIAMLAAPLGIVLGGFCISAFGFRPTVIALAIGVQILSFTMFLFPSLRRMDNPA